MVAYETNGGRGNGHARPENGFFDGGAAEDRFAGGWRARSGNWRNLIYGPERPRERERRTLRVAGAIKGGTE
jgi:hypothetical protein